MLIHSSCNEGERHISAACGVLVKSVSLGPNRQAGALEVDLGPESSSTQRLPAVIHSGCKVLSGGYISGMKYRWESVCVHECMR